MSAKQIRAKSFDESDLADLGDGSHSFVDCTFCSAVLEDAEWAGSSFETCELSGVRFGDADLSDSTFTGCTGDAPVFGNTDLTDAAFERCDFARARFASIVAGGTTWKNSKLLNAVFKDLNGFGWEFRSCVLMYADLRGLGFRKAVLQELDLTEADLRDCDFREARFEVSKLIRADIRGADFSGADMRGADLGPLEDLRTLSALKGAMISPRQARVVANALGIVVVDD